MKVIKYQLCTAVEDSTVFSNVILDWSEGNEQIAKREAYNGEYTIADDGQPEPVAEPTTDEILNAMLGVM